MKHYLTDLTQPIDKTKGPRTRRGYYVQRDGALLKPRPIGDVIGGYLNRCGDELGEGSAVRLRAEAAHDVVRLGHTGWFADDMQDQTIYGIVARLPRSRGFLAGWTMGAGMIANIDRTTVWDNLEDAAHDADRQAEAAAEHERAYQERWQAARRVEEARERIETARHAHTQLVHELRLVRQTFGAGPRFPAVCLALRRQLAEMRDEVRKARREIADLLRDYGGEILTDEYA